MYSEPVPNKLPSKFLPEGVPYIEKLVELPIVGEWQDDGSDADGDGIIDDHEYMYLISSPIGLEVGKTYIVNWNGVDYKVVGQDAFKLTGELPGVVIGNFT
jgi:hypothetical protein